MDEAVQRDNRRRRICVTGAANTTGLILRVTAPGNGANVQANNNGVIYGLAYDTRTRAGLGVGVDRIQI